MANSQQISVVSSVVTDKTEVFYFQPIADSLDYGANPPAAGVYRARLLLDKKAIEDELTWTPLRYMKTSSRTHPQPDALPYNLIMSFDKSAASQVCKVLCNKCRKHKQRVSSPLSVRLITKALSNDCVVELGHIHLCGSFIFYSMQDQPLVQATNVSFCSYSHASQHYCSTNGVSMLSRSSDVSSNVEKELGRVELITSEDVGDTGSVSTASSPTDASSTVNRYRSCQLPIGIAQPRWLPTPRSKSFMSLTCDDDSPCAPSLPRSPSDMCSSVIGGINVPKLLPFPDSPPSPGARGNQYPLDNEIPPRGPPFKRHRSFARVVAPSHNPVSVSLDDSPIHDTLRPQGSPLSAFPLLDDELGPPQCNRHRSFCRDDRINVSLVDSLLNRVDGHSTSVGGRGGGMCPLGVWPPMTTTSIPSVCPQVPIGRCPGWASPVLGSPRDPVSSLPIERNLTMLPSHSDVSCSLSVSGSLDNELSPHGCSRSTNQMLGHHISTSLTRQLTTNGKLTSFSDDLSPLGPLGGTLGGGGKAIDDDSTSSDIETTPLPFKMAVTT